MQNSRYRLPFIEPEKLGRPRWTHFNPIVAGQVEEIYEPLRSYTATLPKTALALQNAFTKAQGDQYQPVGATSSFILTPYHTNLVQAGQLPNPDKFQVEGMFVQIHPDTTPNDAKAFLSQELVTLVIGSTRKYYVEMPPLFLGGANSLFISGMGFQKTAADEWLLATANGWPTTRNLHVLGETLDKGAVLIEQTQNIKAVEDPTQDTGDAAYTTDDTTTLPPGTGIRAFYFLPGHWLRGVQ